VRFHVRVGMALAVAAAIAAAAPAAPALAAGENTLTLTAESAAVVGKPMIIRATGTIPPPGDIPIPYWFSLSAIPTTVTETCPPDRWEGVQFALGSGGTVVVLAQREVPDAAGNFTVPVAVTPSAAGTVLLCGYTDDGLTNTLAGASLLLDIAPASSTGGDSPSTGGDSPSTPSSQGGSGRPSPPVEAAQGIRSCLALLTLSQAKGCIRGAIKRANTRCRRLRPALPRARCLRAVRVRSQRLISNAERRRR
jgi:hypothetical protein